MEGGLANPALVGQAPPATSPWRRRVPLRWPLIGAAVFGAAIALTRTTPWILLGGMLLAFVGPIVAILFAASLVPRFRALHRWTPALAAALVFRALLVPATWAGDRILAWRVDRYLARGPEIAAAVDRFRAREHRWPVAAAEVEGLPWAPGGVECCGDWYGNLRFVLYDPRSVSDENGWELRPDGTWAALAD